MIHVLGKEFGYLSTVDEYDNFHLTVEFKWGEQKFRPREEAKRDSTETFGSDDCSGFID
jgi:hypothetical protein